MSSMPFAVRAKGLMVMQYCVSASLVFVSYPLACHARLIIQNQYVNPIALNRIGWKYYIFYCIWLAFELVDLSSWGRG